MNDSKYIPGRGPLGAKLMILGDCPTERDVIAGKCLTDRELDILLREAGINKSECWLTTVSKFHVPPNVGKKKIPFAIRAKNVGIDVQQQIMELQEEINGIKPNCILALGSTPLWALSGKTKINNYRGSILHGMGRKFVSSYNPAHLSWQASDVEFKGYWNRQIILFDFRRAKHQSSFAELIIPNRTLEICKSSYQLAEFRKRYDNRLKMSVDIEAGGSCLPICIGLALNKVHGMTVPLWNTDGISSIPDADMIQCWIILAEMLYEKEIIGQNFNYDRDKIKRLGFIIRRLISDTMLKAHAINPELPKGLAFNTSLFTEEPFYKDEGMYQGSITDLLTGCARDACVTFEVDENMDSDLDEIGQRSFFENFLMKLPELYWAIEQQGFRIDTVERDALLHKYVEWDEKVRYELYGLVGTEVNVNSPKQISSLLFDNFKLPLRAGTGEEEITALLNSQSAIKKPEHRKVCELILEGRRVRKSISTYLMAMPDFDGRMRTTYFPCLDTGRTSTGQQDPPIRPIIEVIDEHNKKKDKVLGIAFQTMTKHGDIGADIRGMYVPDNFHFEVIDNERKRIEEEEIFVQADSSQAEARVVWLLADDEEALRLVDEIDYHALTATWFFGGTEADYSKKILGYEHPIRFAGKTLRHAGHLGAGKRRAAISVNTDARKYKIPIAITETIAERALMIFHAKQPKIQSVFQFQVSEVVKRSRQLIAPLPYGIDAECGGKRTFFERMGEDLLRQAFSYIPQRAVSDNTKAAALRIRARIPTIKIAMESHDALLFSIPLSKRDEWIPIIRQEMERPINFSRCSLPRRYLKIPCDIEIGHNYRDFKKFRDFPIIAAPLEIPTMVARSTTEQFAIVELPKDTRMDDLIYHHQVEKKLRNFEV
jgi:DNA polymerase I-like protein with 3'-5' exonuclease and polymerase domains/uracil-DNA glycosylase